MSSNIKAVEIRDSESEIGLALPQQQGRETKLKKSQLNFEPLTKSERIDSMDPFLSALLPFELLRVQFPRFLALFSLLSLNSDSVTEGTINLRQISE